MITAISCVLYLGAMLLSAMLGVSAKEEDPTIRKGAKVVFFAALILFIIASMLQIHEAYDEQ